MTAGELIEKLEACDPETEVILWDDCKNGGYKLSEVDFLNSCEGDILLMFNK